MKVIDKDISKKDLFDKLSKISQSDLKKLNLNNNEINYLKHKILNDKLGLVLNFEEKDEFLDNHYFGLEEVKELHINSKDKNNHLLIEGDNYYALKTLKLSGIKVDVIYIDPPYNTGNKDFVYNDNFVEKDDQFKHSKWLSFMKKRLILAKELLADDGVIFVSIDDNEQAYLKVLMDEIFGEENFSNQICWVSNKKGRQISGRVFSKTHEYVLVYTKSTNDIEHEIDRNFAENIMPYVYNKKEIKIFNDGISEYIIQNELHNTNISKFNINTRPNLFFPIFSNGKDISLIEKAGWTKLLPPKNFDNIQGVWRWSKDKIEIEKENLFIMNSKDKISIFTKKRNIKYKTKDLILASSITTKSGTDDMEKIGLNFDYPKPVSLIKFLLNFSNPNSLILDFFAGSGTTGQAVMELNEEDGGNRRFILCTNNENNIAKDITRERIYRVINEEGSKGQKIDWQYSEDKKSLKNNSVKYLTIKSINKYDGQYEEIDDMKKIYKNEFNKELSIKDFK